MDDASGPMVMVGIMAGISSLGFYLFLAVWVATVIWSRTKERLAVQETLRKLIDSGAPLTADVIDALRRPKPRRSPEETRVSAKRYLYWGTFLVVLGLVITIWGTTFSDSAVQDLRELPLTGFVFFVIPGLFCLAHSVIMRWTSVAPRD